MSAPVDLLAVMDQAIQREKDAGQPYAAQEAARAAVAELIEVAESFSDDASICGMDTRRIDAALARVKGGAA